MDMADDGSQGGTATRLVAPLGAGSRIVARGRGTEARILAEAEAIPRNRATLVECPQSTSASARAERRAMPSA